MANRERYDNSYGSDDRDDRGRRSSGLLETIKRDVKSWFDDDDDDDRDDVRSYDLRDRSGRRYRSDFDEQSASDYRYGRSRYPHERPVHDRPNYGRRYASPGSADYTGDDSDYDTDRDYRFSRDETYRSGDNRGYSDYRSSRYDREFSRRQRDARSREYDRDYDRYGDGYARGDYGRSRSEDQQQPRMPYGGGYMARGSAPGPYSGIGPKGYKRSTDRLKEQVCDALEDDGDLDASDIEVSIDDNCEVTLSGTVRSRRDKRMAEDCAESVRGVEDVHNRLKVSRDRDDNQGSESKSTRSASGKSGRSNSTSDARKSDKSK